MIVHTCEQGTPEWYAARLGIPTASEFKTIIGVKKDARDKITRRTYMLKLAGEILTGQCMENYVNEHMERGKKMEAEARRAYAFIMDAEPQLVGFITDDARTCGGSPDSLIETAGLLEIKTKLPHLNIDCILKDEFPPEHKAQSQGQLMVSERDWTDICVYWPGIQPFIKRAYRDEDYIAQLADAVVDFNGELAEIVARLRGESLADSQLKASLAHLETTNAK